MSATAADADPYTAGNKATRQVLYDDLLRAFQEKVADFQTSQSELLRVREELPALLKEKAKVEDAESELLKEKQAVGSLEQELDSIQGVLNEMTAERDQALELARAAEHKLAAINWAPMCSDVAEIKQWFETGTPPTFAPEAFPDLQQLLRVRPAYPPVCPILSDPSVCYRMSACCGTTSRT